MEVLFIVEAGGKYGLGHLMRSTVMIDAMRARSKKSIVALRAGESGIPDWAMPATECVALLGNAAAAARQAAALAAKRPPGWVVIDGYDILATGLVAQLRTLGLRVMTFDDLGSDGGGANLVINQNRRTAATADAAGSGRLLGPHYALLDPTYVALRGRPVAGTIGHVLVTFGGSDQHAVTGRVVGSFADIPKELSLDVVVGPYHRIRSFAPPGRHRLTVHEEPHGLAALISAADLVISAAGTTCWQVCCVGVPLIAVQTVDNQRDVIRCLSEAGCAIVLGRDEFCALMERGGLQELIGRLSDTAALGAMVAAQRRLIDGNGAARVLAAMAL
jgi:spore coat polysaccharide biosynthesis predicted glycosyltransferase SpsG